MAAETEVAPTGGRVQGACPCRWAGVLRFSGRVVSTNCAESVATKAETLRGKETERMSLS